MFQTEHHSSALTNPRRTENIRLEPSKTNPSLLVSLSKCYPIPLNALYLSLTLGQEYSAKILRTFENPSSLL